MCIDDVDAIILKKTKNDIYKLKKIGSSSIDGVVGFLNNQKDQSPPKIV
tara:strand:- start:644 stop:790 length:147 start_codon:yes stop_codon:yes gene_type:complete